MFPLYFLSTLYDVYAWHPTARVRKYKGNTVRKHKPQEKSRFLAGSHHNFCSPASKYHLLTFSAKIGLARGLSLPSPNVVSSRHLPGGCASLHKRKLQMLQIIAAKYPIFDLASSGPQRPDSTPRDEPGHLRSPHVPQSPPRHCPGTPRNPHFFIGNAC